MKRTDAVTFLFAEAGLNPQHSSQAHTTARPVAGNLVIFTLRQRISIVCDRRVVCYPSQRVKGAAKVRRAQRDPRTNTAAQSELGF